jgi:hypothetical protein
MPTPWSSCGIASDQKSAPLVQWMRSNDVKPSD